VITIDDMVRMGLHFGHQTQRWNPKMAPYIFTKRNGIHIIDLIQTYSYLKKSAIHLWNDLTKAIFCWNKKASFSLDCSAAFDEFLQRKSKMRWRRGC